MKVVLVILCAISILFAGGCLIAVGGEMGSGNMLVPLLFAALCFNGLFIWAALSKERIAAIALIICAIVDVGLSLVLTQFFNDQYVGPLVWIPFVFFLAKALLGAWIGYRRLTAGNG
jgi:hypothetical protein